MAGILESLVTAVVNTIGDEYDRIERHDSTYDHAVSRTDAAAKQYSREAHWHNYHAANAAQLEAECRRLEILHYANPYDTGIAAAYRNAYAELRRHQHEAEAQRKLVRKAEKELRRAQDAEARIREDYVYMDESPVRRIIDSWF